MAWLNGVVGKAVNFYFIRAKKESKVFQEASFTIIIRLKVKAYTFGVKG